MNPVELMLPFADHWLVQNSPARRVPSHGTHLLGTTYAIDFVGVDERGRTAPSISWRTAFASEPPELFYAFGRQVLSPVSGVIVGVHDGEVDHEARRAPLALLSYMAGQAGRLRQGLAAIGGNYVLIEAAPNVVVGLMHLKRSSVRVAMGETVEAGSHLADCGNSGNSTQPHLHLQAMDSSDPTTAHGLPIAFSAFSERSTRGAAFLPRRNAVPSEGSIIRGA
jgi:hypothetical protein